MTSKTIQKRLARSVANIFIKEVLEVLYNFNHLSLDNVNWTQSWNSLFECNGTFPTMNGYSWNDDRHKRNGGEGHWADNLSFFAWKYYTNTYDLEHPETMMYANRYNDYILDGKTNYWIVDEPNYIIHINNWGSSCRYNTYVYNQNLHYIPIEVCSPDDETATDRFRREQYYTKHLCIWGLNNCDCSTTGSMCNKTESEIYGYDISSISYN